MSRHSVLWITASRRWGSGGKIRVQEAEENDDVAYGSVGRHVNA